MVARRNAIRFLLSAVLALGYYSPSATALMEYSSADRKKTIAPNSRPGIMIPPKKKNIGVLQRLNLAGRLGVMERPSRTIDRLEEAHRLVRNAGLAVKEGLLSSKSAMVVVSALLAIVLASTGGLSSIVRGFVWLFQGYNQMMMSRPLETKVATGAILAVMGDALAQAGEAGEYSPRRAMSFAVFDSCNRTFQHNAFPAIVGLCQGHVFANALSAVSAVMVGGNLRRMFAAMESTIFYQFGVVPFFYYPMFFSFTGLIQGLTLQETLQRAKTSFGPCWRRSLMFWIPTQLVMFGVVGENWQIPFACIMGIMWSTILSVTAGRARN